MAHTPKQYKIGDPMSKGTFESFIRHFPNQWLRDAGNILEDDYKTLSRVSFYAVAHGLVEIGEFKSGEDFRLSQVAIADITGTSPKTVRRVLALLEKTGAITHREDSKRPGGGTPVKNYALTYSKYVHQVLTVLDRNVNRDEWKREPRTKTADSLTSGSTTPMHQVAEPHSVGSTTPANREQNPTTGVFMNVQASSSSLSPSARSDEAKEERNELINAVGSPWTFDDLFAGLDDVEQNAAEDTPTAWYQNSDWQALKEGL